MYFFQKFKFYFKNSVDPDQLTFDYADFIHNMNPIPTLHNFCHLLSHLHVLR